MTNKYQILLWIGIICFVIYFSFLAIIRYRTLNSYYYDLGIMNQVVYNTSRGRFLEMTNQDLKKNTSRLAIHFDPILVVFAPFYKLYPGPEVLLISQTIVLGLGAWAIYLISEKVLNRKFITLIFSLTYLFYFAVQRAVLFDFHAVVLATTFFLFAIYFNLVKKIKLYFFFIILALLTKEHVGLVVFLLGLYLLIIKKEIKVGITTLTLGLFFFILTVYFIIPYFRGSEHFAMGYFSDIKSRWRDIFSNGLSYSLKLIPPVFYSLFSPITLAISLPEWAINILSLNNNLRSIYFHYNSIIVSFLFFSLILGYKNFDKFVKSKILKMLFFLLFIFFNLRSIYLYNPVPESVRQPVKYKPLSDITQQSIEMWVKKLQDENIRVSTTPKLAPFFTNRKFYDNFLFDSAYSEIGLVDDDIISTIDDYKTAEYVIIYRPEIGRLDKQTLTVRFYTRLREDREFEMIYSDNLDDRSLEVYKKI